MVHASCPLLGTQHIYLLLSGLRKVTKDSCRRSSSFDGQPTLCREQKVPMIKSTRSSQNSEISFLIFQPGMLLCTNKAIQNVSIQDCTFQKIKKKKFSSTTSSTFDLHYSMSEADLHDPHRSCRPGSLEGEKGKKHPPECHPFSFSSQYETPCHRDFQQLHACMCVSYQQFSMLGILVLQVRDMFGVQSLFFFQ